MAERKTGRTSKASFGEAIEEVEGILARLEAEQIDIDDLSREVKRAVELIKLCRQKLAKTDEEVRDLVADLQAEPVPDREETAVGPGEEGRAGLDPPF